MTEEEYLMSGLAPVVMVTIEELKEYEREFPRKKNREVATYVDPNPKKSHFDEWIENKRKKSIIN